MILNLKVKAKNIELTEETVREIFTTYVRQRFLCKKKKTISQTFGKNADKPICTKINTFGFWKIIRIWNAGGNIKWYNHVGQLFVSSV